MICDGKGIRLIETYWNDPEWKVEKVLNGKTFDIEKVAAVIFCTGYYGNYNMIQPSGYDFNGEFELSTKFINDWKMPENCLTKILGDVKPCEWLHLSCLCVTWGYYYGIHLGNPNIMYMPQYTDSPIFEIDVASWVLLKHLMGEVHLPTYDEQEQYIHRQAMRALEEPALRSLLDPNYYQAIANHSDDDLYKFLGKKEWLQRQAYQYKFLGEQMKEADYPVNILTPDGELNEIGNRLAEMTIENLLDRMRLPKEEQEWRTFRDVKDTHIYTSIYSGAVAAPLKKRWLDLKDDEKVY